MSHVTGMVSQLADQRVLGQFSLAGIAAVSWIAFASGAACTTLMFNYMRRRGARNLFAVALLAEALLILLFGTFGGTHPQHELAFITLCFTMGLQNALIIEISLAEIPTTHLTGLTTDLSIEIGNLLYWIRRPARRVPAGGRLPARSASALPALFLPCRWPGPGGDRHCAGPQSLTKRVFTDGCNSNFERVTSLDYRAPRSACT